MKFIIAMAAGIIGLINLFHKSKKADIWVWVGPGEDPFKR